MTPNQSLKLRRLQAAMKLKGLSLTTVADSAHINLSVACLLLNGRRESPLKLEKLSAVIKNAPMPAEPMVSLNAQ